MSLYHELQVGNQKISYVDKPIYCQSSHRLINMFDRKFGVYNCSKCNFG